MPEDTELTRRFSATFEAMVGIVDTDELVILSDDLLRLFVAQRKVLDVVQ
ncbi:MAG: hypothetical protein R3C53_00895 [Pirellulaceae bacterium]